MVLMAAALVLTHTTALGALSLPSAERAPMSNQAGTPPAVPFSTRSSTMIIEHAELVIAPGRETQFEEAFARGH
jgi:hypothetical protein